MTDIAHRTDCRQALATIKQRIQTSQTRAVIADGHKVIPQLVG